MAGTLRKRSAARISKVASPAQQLGDNYTDEQFEAALFAMRAPAELKRSALEPAPVQKSTSYKLVHSELVHGITIIGRRVSAHKALPVLTLSPSSETTPSPPMPKVDKLLEHTAFASLLCATPRPKSARLHDILKAPVLGNNKENQRGDEWVHTPHIATRQVSPPPKTAVTAIRRIINAKTPITALRAPVPTPAQQTPTLSMKRTRKALGDSTPLSPKALMTVSRQHAIKARRVSTIRGVFEQASVAQSDTPHPSRIPRLVASQSAKLIVTGRTQLSSAAVSRIPISKTRLATSKSIASSFKTITKLRQDVPLAAKSTNSSVAAKKPKASVAVLREVYERQLAKKAQDTFEADKSHFMRSTRASRTAAVKVAKQQYKSSTRSSNTTRQGLATHGSTKAMKTATSTKPILPSIARLDPISEVDDHDVFSSEVVIIGSSAFRNPSKSTSMDFNSSVSTSRQISRESRFVAHLPRLIRTPSEFVRVTDEVVTQAGTPMYDLPEEDLLALTKDVFEYSAMPPVVDSQVFDAQLREFKELYDDGDEDFQQGLSLAFRELRDRIRF